LDPTVHRLIESVHHRPAKFVLAVTGGGTSVPGLLLSVPGGSRTVLEVVVPYHEQSFVEFLGHHPEQFTSAPTSREMAARALERARWLAPGEPVLGVSCTASLASDRPKRGEHRFHLCVHGSERATTYSVVLHKGARTREAEEGIVAAVLLNALAEAVGSPERLSVPLLADESIQIETMPADPLARLFGGEASALCVQVDGRLSVVAPRPQALLSGAFNPVHIGHWRLAEVAANLGGGPVAFELSVINVDKPPLTVEETRRRLQQFTWRCEAWLTRAPTFEEKAALFPGAAFVIGADTAERLVAPRYYGNHETRMVEALERIRALGCRFIVAGREDRERKFVGLEELHLPAFIREIFTGIPEAAFRVPVSSTALREVGQRRRAEDAAVDEA